MKRWMAIGLIACGLVLPTQAVWADRIGIHDAADSPRYGRKAIGMVGRGLLNAATCFVDVLTNTVNESRHGAPVMGTLEGLARGTGCGLLRLGSGAVDLVTFWVPGYHGAPVSASYDNCLAVE